MAKQSTWRRWALRSERKLQRIFQRLQSYLIDRSKCNIQELMQMETLTSRVEMMGVVD